MAATTDQRFRSDWTVGVSLSGGGFRATAFSLGALLALHDAGLWNRIRWISSVSGGSFLNAAAAVRLTASPTRTEVDGFVRWAAGTLSQRGALVGLRREERSATERGLVSRAFAAGVQRLTQQPGGGQPRLADLARDDRLHVFMAADLGSSLPIVLSDRLVFSEGMADEWQVAHRPGELLLATAVRASATFPGLPAVRLRSEDLGEPLEPAEHDLLLIDGGAWNNLGTDWMRVVPWFERGEVLPSSIPRNVDLHILVDASAPPARKSGFWTRRPLSYESPGIGLIRAGRVAVQSTVVAYRRELSSSRADTAVVDLGMWPQQIHRRSALDTGYDEEQWHGVAQLNQAIGTVRPTAMGLSRSSTRRLILQAHALVHAHLVDRGLLPYRTVPPSPDRLSGLV